MKGTLIIGFLLSIVITVFALSNNEYVTINYLFGEDKIVIPLLIFILLGMGSLITVLFSIPGWWKSRNQRITLKKENLKLSKELTEARGKLIELQQASAPSSSSIHNAANDDFTKNP